MALQRFMERAKELSQDQVIRRKRQGEQSVITSGDKRRRNLDMPPAATEVTTPTEPQSNQERVR